MPLIIHPSSCCDICLESLTYNDKPPFAIPCGHIFCRSCLFEINPSLCPLCRKPFLPERSKKLITGDMEIPEVDGLENRTAIELLTKLVDSLDTEGHDSTTLEVDVWLRSGNTHTLLQKAHDVLKEYLLLKSEKSANLRSIRRLERDMHRLQVEKSDEKESASTIEKELLSQIRKLQKKVRKFEERHRAATTITFNHNPLPTPPEPVPLESLPFLANLQQNCNSPNEILSQNSSDYRRQSTAHLSGEPANSDVWGLAAAAPWPSSTTQLSIPSNPIPTLNEHSGGHNNAIIPGASPSQRFIPGTLRAECSDSTQASIYEQSAVQVDPFALATGYLAEYAAGFEEGYQLNHRNRQERRPESVFPSLNILTTSQPARRPLGLQDFYATPTSSPSYRPHDPAPRVSSPRRSTLRSSSSPPTRDEQRSVPSNWSTLPTPSTSPPVDTTSDSSSLPPSPFASASPFVSASNIAELSLPPPSTSAAFSVTPATSSDAGSSRSSRTSSLLRVSRSNLSSVEIPWDSASQIPASNTSVAHLRQRSSPLLGVDGSPASTRSMESWGTVSASDPNRVFHRPFRPAHQIRSVSDLELRLFDDLTHSSHAGTASQRSSLLSEVQPFSPSQNGLEDSDVGNYRSDSQNRTPRVVPRQLPRTESLSSLEGGLPSFVPPRGADRYWNISRTTPSFHDDLDNDHSQHHGTPLDASQTWNRATADLASIRSSPNMQSHSHSQSISGPVSDRSSRTLRQRTSRPSTASTHNDPTSSRWESTNALGLTDLTPSQEPRISAPTPITPSQSFLRYYHEYSR